MGGGEVGWIGERILLQSIQIQRNVWLKELLNTDVWQANCWKQNYPQLQILLLQAVQWKLTKCYNAGKTYSTDIQKVIITGSNVNQQKKHLTLISYCRICLHFIGNAAVKQQGIIWRYWRVMFSYQCVSMENKASELLSIDIKPGKPLISLFLEKQTLNLCVMIQGII